MARMRSDFSFIPEELLIEIISRLPLKSAARFKCLSKRWEYLISNSTFVASRTKAFVISISGHELFSFHSINHEASVESVQTFPGLQWHHTVIAHCSCDSLLLIQIDDDLFVWNPLTGFFRKVLSFDRLIYARYVNYDLVVGLCYDSTVNKYKVLLSYSHVDGSLHMEDMYVGTCGDSTWKTLYCRISCVNPGPYFKGHIHWYCNHVDRHDKFFKSHYIVYFDPSTDDFIDVPMPRHKNGDENVMLGLGVYDGCLCMARWCDPGDQDGNVEFLAMKEYGNGNSWATMFVIPCMGYKMVPLFVTKGGKALLYTHYSGCHEIKGYDATDSTLSNISIPRRHDQLDVVVYEENWCSPTSYNWDKFDPLQFEDSIPED